MPRRCSHCSNNGHNSRTCPTRPSSAAAAHGGSGGVAGGVRLFGVRLTDGSIMKKSASMGNLSAHYHSSSSAAASPNRGSPDPGRDPAGDPVGYLSDDPDRASSSRRGERKKGVPWTEEEHRLFLVGLQKLGKGDWRGIARNFVVSRTPTQVASHAQKYFIRQSNATRRKRRSSLFDMAPDMATDPSSVPEEQMLLPPPPPGKESDETNTSSFPSLNLSLSSEFHPMDATPQEPEENTGEVNVGPGFFPAYIPAPYPIWPPNALAPPENEKGMEISHHRVLKPIPIHRKEPVNVDELVGMSQLSIGEAGNGQPLSLTLLGEPSRLSAFHASVPAGGSGLGNGKSKSVIRAA